MMQHLFPETCWEILLPSTPAASLHLSVWRSVTDWRYRLWKAATHPPSPLDLTIFSAMRYKSLSHRVLSGSNRKERIDGRSGDVWMGFFVCVFREKLPWCAQQTSMAEPTQSRPGPPQTLTKKLLFPPWPTHITRLPLPKTRRYLITFAECSSHRLSVTQYTTRLYIIQLKPLLMPQQRTRHTIRGPNSWKKDSETMKGYFWGAEECL